MGDRSVGFDASNYQPSGQLVIEATNNRPVGSRRPGG
nr:MAG TPA: hypothetical protein [Caudoviricetes sp.]